MFLPIWAGRLWLAAIFAVVKARAVEKVAQALDAFEGRTLHLSLTDDQLVRLATEVDETEA